MCIRDRYYNTEPKAAAFAKNGKITKEEIPAVTQLFTPDWIVRYMAVSYTPLVPLHIFWSTC